MAVGIFGGTFDPVHIGHLRTALELKFRLGLAEMRFIPSARPPHRDEPSSSAEHRLAMLLLALRNEPGLVVDDCELKRDGPSYSIETLRHIRAELGDKTPLCLCIGMDALISLDRWHQWQELINYAHIVVTARPGWSLPESGDVLSLVQQHRTNENDLLTSANGNIAIVEMTRLPVSATGIRQAFVRREPTRYLLPDAVLEYITKHRLYLEDQRNGQ